MTTVDVEIFGKKFRFRGEDPQKIKDYAAFLNSMLEDTHRRLDTIDVHTIFTLTSMNIVEKLFQSEEKSLRLSTELDSINSALGKFIEEEI